MLQASCCCSAWLGAVTCYCMAPCAGMLVGQCGRRWCSCSVCRAGSCKAIRCAGGVVFSTQGQACTVPAGGGGLVTCVVNAAGRWQEGRVEMWRCGELQSSVAREGSRAVLHGWPCCGAHACSTAAGCKRWQWSAQSCAECCWSAGCRCSELAACSTVNLCHAGFFVV